MEDSPPFLLPSEIARLIYGHLKSINCHNVAAKFLFASPHLEESRKLIKEDRTFWTQAHGLSLNEILDQYLAANDSISEAARKLCDTDLNVKDSAATLNFLLNMNEPKSVVDHKDTDVITELVADVINHEVSAGVCHEIKLSDNEASSIESKSTTGNIINNADSVPNVCPEDGNMSKRISRKPARYENFILPKQGQTRLVKNCVSSEDSKIHEERKKVKSSKQKEKITRKITLSQSESSEMKNEQLQVVIKDSHFITLDKVGTESHNLKESNISSKHCPSVFERKPPEICKRTSARLQLRSKPNYTSSAIPSKSQRRTWKNSSKFNEDPELRKNPIVANEDVNLARIQQMLIDDSKWPELIADNINKKISATPEKKIQVYTNNSAVIKSIAEETLSKDVCDEFIRSLLGCTQNITQESEDKNTCDENVADRNSVISGKIDKPTNHSNGLQDDLNEFIKFHSQKPSNEINSQSEVIIIQMPQDKQNINSSNDYIVENDGHSSYISYASNTVPTQNGIVETEDEIVTFYPETHGGVVIAPLLPTATFENSLYDNPLPLSYETKKNGYRPIAPKPESCKTVDLQNASAIWSRRRTTRK